jgi:hypothetical protein
MSRHSFELEMWINCLLFFDKPQLHYQSLRFMPYTRPAIFDTWAMGHMLQTWPGQGMEHTMGSCTCIACNPFACWRLPQACPLSVWLQTKGMANRLGTTIGQGFQDLDATQTHLQQRISLVFEIPCLEIPCYGNDDSRGARRLCAQSRRSQVRKQNLDARRSRRERAERCLLCCERGALHWAPACSAERCLFARLRGTAAEGKGTAATASSASSMSMFRRSFVRPHRCALASQMF